MEDSIKDLEWNENSKIQKGVKGFVKVSDDKKKSKVINVKFTDKQKDFITRYCKDKNLTASNLIRYTLYKYLESNNEDLSDFKDVVPINQTNLFEDNNL